MEWCHMFSLRLAVCCVLLRCGLAFSDTYRRDERLRQMMREYEEARPVQEPPLQNHPSFDHLNHESSAMRDKMTHSFPGEDEDSYQDFYRVMYGTQEGVNFLRKHYGPNGLQQARAANRAVKKGVEEVRLANAHYLKIRTRARCRVPSPQLVRVKDFYPDPSREYMPRCTLLHRCGDAAGCCDSDAFHCVPAAVQEVTLHFYTINVDKNGIANMKGHGIEKLLFENHTRCQCQPVNDMPRMSTGHNLLQDGKDDRRSSSSSSKCLDCPVPFTSRTFSDGRCGCDCFDHQRPCLRIKRGREPLSNIERRCVLANHCHIPECEFGKYDKESGLCPKRQDASVKHRPHSHEQKRWTMFERD